MIYNVLQYLEKDAESIPDRIALADEFSSMTYKEYMLTAKIIGTYLNKAVNGRTESPIAVLVDRNIRSICAFIGVVYSGNFYVPIDTSMPEDRVRLIYEVLDPVYIIDARNNEGSETSDKTGRYSEITADTQIDEKELGIIRERSIDTDPLYSIFTSGSTGIPKGVLISHRSVIDLVGSFEEAFGFDETNVFGNQAPFDFDVSVKDIFNALYAGAAVQVIPKRLFKTPKPLLEYLRDKKIDTLIWAVSALRIISDFRALDDEDITLKNIMFSGEVMPVKSLNYWMDRIPDARYVNLFGPTEITCNCTYYVIDKNTRYKDDDKIPIGRSFKNCRVFLMGDNGVIDKCNEIGEICVEGTCLALGYWNSSEKTDAVFVADPNITAYENKMYKTGDLGYYNGDHDLVFASRKDHQIKHMGHRIELGEIEVALNAIPFLTIACCIYDEAREKIVCHYQSTEERKKDIVIGLSKKLPKYMWPNVYVRHDALPLNKNGKIDRVALKQYISE